MGRLPLITPLMPLDRAALVRILLEPKNALVRQYQHLFSLEGAQLEFTPAALDLIAQKALDRNTGARALRAVVDELMLDLMYALPELDNAGVTYCINDDAVRAGRATVDNIRRLVRESA
jgi:ATP-dependent Clp protease ATP-binding subunit ClpX